MVTENVGINSYKYILTMVTHKETINKNHGKEKPDISGLYELITHQ